MRLRRTGAAAEGRCHARNASRSPCPHRYAKRCRLGMRAGIRRAVSWREPDERFGATYFVRHNRDAPEIVPRLLRLHGLWPATRSREPPLERKSDGRRDMSSTARSFRESGMRLPSDLGVHKLFVIAPPLFQLADPNTLVFCFPAFPKTC
jgi:hypothetical protein